jgi:thioredoxin 1
MASQEFIKHDESPQTTAKYQVQSIPTLQIFKGGDINETKIGMMNRAQLSAWIDRHL